MSYSPYGDNDTVVNPCNKTPKKLTVKVVCVWISTWHKVCRKAKNILKFDTAQKETADDAPEV
jgi:hypothetical protein